MSGFTDHDKDYLGALIDPLKEGIVEVKDILKDHDARTAVNAGAISWLKGGIAVAAFIIMAYIAYIKL